MSELNGFHYLGARHESDSVPLLLLHGSSGHESDLIPLAESIAPDRPYNSIRGGLAWENGFAFFRRNADRTLDYDDLDYQTQRLCSFLAAALEKQLFKHNPVLFGFSNGAIAAASILLHKPQLASGAILARPLSPAPAASFPNMKGLPVLITAGEFDQRRAPADVRLVTSQFESSGAIVTTHLLPTGHELHRDEVGLIRNWIDTQFAAKAAL
jgi:phospholipase/carboxylesterase